MGGWEFRIPNSEFRILPFERLFEDLLIAGIPDRVDFAVFDRGGDRTIRFDLVAAVPVSYTHLTLPTILLV